MCGLAGSFRDPGFDVGAALTAIAHRGPDAHGVDQEGPAIHGHVRLSILDLSHASDQPFRYRDGLLSFNGEVWNFRELRDELAGLGFDFRTTGDTEVLAAALSIWGEDALPRLDGMFAFAWSWSGSTLLARDRFGKVPLYVYRRGAAWAWCSERKGLGRSRQALPLPPGAVLDLTTGQVRRWYALPKTGSGGGVGALVRAGVQRRMIADAPLCCLVSGGLDSSLVLTIAKQLKPDIVAYTASLDGYPSKDIQRSREVCQWLQVPLVEVAVPPPSTDDLAAAVRAIEIPMKAQVEIAALCLPLAARIAADGFKVCLSGEGADELFGGYGSMCIKGASVGDAGWRLIRAGQVEKMSRGNFIRCNKAFMAHGVECRLPFLDRELVEGVLAMSKADCPPNKGALKVAAEREGVPRAVTRRPKETFQGGAGMDVHAARVLGNPARFYRAEAVNTYGRSVVARS